jgi:hypothetical protein
MKARDPWSYIVRVLRPGRPAGRNEIANYSGEELLALIGPSVAGGQCMDWRGIELFWGRKPEGQP